MELVDSAGRRISIGKELFRGGEGTIHPVSGHAWLLAKLYHGDVDAPKRAKLTAMTATANDALLRVAAWPSATLHSSGHMVGFLMPRFDGKRFELHDLYRPGTRKQTFRQADWSFLIHAARNVAAAVATVHAAGHVVGDVNQRNFIVGADATVKVLDCDSFQIRGPHQLFRCPVGVPEFTPPELQNRVLESIDRTPNHDAFGLAVLVFQLLFMGRHPFAGRFLGGGDMPIERAIAEGRFAFGPHNRSRMMEAPPNMVPFESLPPRLGALFDAAFAGNAARPSAKNWSDALDFVQTELRACTLEPMHKYYKALPDCSWCRLERAGGVYFFIGVASAAASGFDLGKLWAELLAVTGLPYESPARPTFQVAGTPVPMALSVRRRAAVTAKIAGSLLLGGAAVVSPDWIVMVMAAFVVIVCLPLPGAAERKQRLRRFREAERGWNDAYRAAENAVSGEPLLRKRAELQPLMIAHERADTEKNSELAKLTQNARQIQMHHYLERHLIRAHSISDIGPKRKATLAAWGIETAADVTWSSLRAVQGFGPTLQARLMTWRAAIESRFVFDAKRGIPQPDLDAMEYRWRRRKADLEQQLRAGVEEARRIHQAIRNRRQTINEQLETPARTWAQAYADLELINQSLKSERSET